MSSRSPGTIGAGIGSFDRLVAPAGNPAALAPAPLQTSGASFGFGVLLLSLVTGIFATPVGIPCVLGVGACAYTMAPVARTASSPTIARAADGQSASNSKTVPTAIHKPTNRLIARYRGISGATGFAGG